MRQIHVVEEAGADVIAELIEAIAAAGVNIETLDSEALPGTLVARLTVDRYDDAMRALNQAGFHAIGEDVLLVRLEDRPGALAELARRFHAAGIPLRSVRIIRRGEGSGIVAVSTPRLEEARELVRDVLLG
ncbi:MAG: acetolactate synthase [Isosphaeraceae bacterium]|jgi:hypothetical protein|nr:MAG: acetolactate synthase [Isosphaeraceae bacterium]